MSCFETKMFRSIYLRTGHDLWSEDFCTFTRFSTLRVERNTKRAFIPLISTYNFVYNTTHNLLVLKCYRLKYKLLKCYRLQYKHLKCYRLQY